MKRTLFHTDEFRALLRELPELDEYWAPDERGDWLDAAAALLDEAYGCFEIDAEIPPADEFERLELKAQGFIH